jgi:hypothetical protein
MPRSSSQPFTKRAISVSPAAPGMRLGLTELIATSEASSEPQAGGGGGGVGFADSTDSPKRPELLSTILHLLRHARYLYFLGNGRRTRRGATAQRFDECNQPSGISRSLPSSGAERGRVTAVRRRVCQRSLWASVMGASPLSAGALLASVEPPMRSSHSSRSRRRTPDWPSRSPASKS